MSYVSEITQACPAIQQSLDDAWRQRTFLNQFSEPMPLLEYLASPANRSAVQDMIIRGTGQIGIAELTYLKRFLLSEGRTDVTWPDCSGGDSFGNTKETYTLDYTKNVASRKQLFNLLDYVNACPTPVELLGQQLQRHIDQLDRLVAEKTAAQVVAGAGAWAASVQSVTADVLTIKSLKVDGESIDPRAHVKIMNGLQDSAAPMATPLFGGSTGREYYQASAIGCCSNEGLGIADALNAYGKAYGYDFYLQAATSRDEWVAVAPNAVQLLNWNKAVLNNAMGAQWLTSADYVMLPFTSPRTGITYDFVFSNNCGAMTVFGVGVTEAIFLPADMYQSGDNLEGVNGVYKGEFDNCAAPDCA